MTVKDKDKTKSVVGFLVRLGLVVVVLLAVAYGLGLFTSFLADVTHEAPKSSMKEVISGFGTLIFGLFTAIAAASVLGTFGFWLFGFFNPDIFTDEKCNR